MPTSETDVLQNDLDALYTWSDLWEMKFNTNKCKAIHYGKDNPNIIYTMNNTKLLLFFFQYGKSST